MDWCTIESDPGVFSELIEGIGVENVEVEELIDLDELIAQNRHVYGLIFLFKYVSEPDTRPIDYSPNIYFAKQVIENACATQAILNVLLNRPDVKLGEQLNYFKDFTKDLEPDMRGMAIGNSDQIRLIHNSFSRPEPFLFEKEKEQDQEGEDAFHFIGYVPVGGGLYELDGLKRGPIKVADLSNNDAWKTNQGWLVAAKEAITSRITRYAAKEIRFNLLALTTNRLQECESQLSLLSKKKLAIEKKLSGDAAMDTETGTEVGPLPSAENELKELLTNTVSQLSLLEHSASEEREKRHRWKVENIRRRHNYVPFIFSLLNTLAEKGKLQSVTESAQKVANDRAARLKELKAKKKAEKEKEKEKTAAAS